MLKKINSNEIVMSIQNSREHTTSLVLLDCHLLSFEILIDSWTDIEWWTVNTQTIIYKQRSTSIVNIFRICDKRLSIISFDIEDKSIVQVFSSTNGKYLVMISTQSHDATMKSMKMYRIETIENGEQGILTFERTNLKNYEGTKFIGDEYLIYQHREGTDRLTHCYDLANNNLYLWFRDDDSQGSFDCLKDERSKYIWYQRHQVSRMNKVKTDISVFHIQDVSKPVCSLDVDCRLKINQVALFDNGNAMLVKVLDKLEFVAFFPKSKIAIGEENTIHFDNFRFDDSTSLWTLKKNTFYQFCHQFSLIDYVNTF